MTYRLPQTPTPAKALQGAPCSGCGVCCSREICPAGTIAMPDAVAPCPALTLLQGRYWCGLVLGETALRHQDPTILPLLSQALGIGQGCTMDESMDTARARRGQEETP